MKNILCFGDSNTWGYDFTSYDPEIGSGQRMAFDERWPGIVQLKLGYDNYHIIEDALNARTTVYEDYYSPHRNGLKALEMALDLHAPLDLVIIQMGVNELKHLYNLSAGMIAYGIEKLVVTAKQSFYKYPEPKVLLISPAPVKENIADMIFGFSFGPLAYEKSVALGGYCKDIAKRHGCGFIDCAEMNFEINTLDGLHYSKNDHKKLANAVADMIPTIIG